MQRWDGKHVWRVQIGWSKASSLKSCPGNKTQPVVGDPQDLQVRLREWQVQVLCRGSYHLTVRQTRVSMTGKRDGGMAEPDGGGPCWLWQGVHV